MHRTLTSLALPVALLAVAVSASAQSAPTKPPPVIDIHAARFLRLDKASTTSSNGMAGQ